MNLGCHTFVANDDSHAARSSQNQASGNEAFDDAEVCQEQESEAQGFY